MTGKEKILISFSGGRTSAYMTYWMLNEWKDRDKYEMIVVFANTGKEAEETLFFVDECSQEWNIPIVWVEAMCKDENGVPFSEKGWSVRHKIVTYETASRNGEPFEEMISVLGIPSTEAPFCSPQLKKKAIESYANEIWGGEKYKVAIGIRHDEPQRINENYLNLGILYPLATLNPVTKRMIKEWWDKQTFDLTIHPDDGNCDGCWKKSFVVLTRIMIRKPSVFDWWDEMSVKYGYYNPREIEYAGARFNFYRGNKSVLDIKKLAELSQAELKQLTMFDPIDGCSESCEVF